MNYDAYKLMENMFEGVYVVDRLRKIIYWNKGSERISGYSAEEVVGSHCYQEILRHVTADGKRLCKEGCPLTDTIKSGKTLEYDVFLHHKDGHRVPVTVKTMPVYDEDGQIIAAIEVFTDTRYKESKYQENQELKKLVEIDSLTQIYNRRYLDFIIKSSIEEYKEFKIDFGILFIDIDDFKNVNDIHGHLAGDEVLKTITKTIKENIKQTDYLGRWGGEEFVIILKKTNLSELKEISEKIRILCENTIIKTNDLDLRVTVSIGATLCNEGDTLKSIVDKADSLMYKSKTSGKNKVTV